MSKLSFEKLNLLARNLPQETDDTETEAAASPNRQKINTKVEEKIVEEIKTPKQNSEEFRRIAISELIPFPDQPFKPYTQEKLDALIASINVRGIITPIVVRPYNNVYQIISGHNRVNASATIGLPDAPAIIRVLDDETARLDMIETNLNQRQNLFPSEKALAYRMRMEILEGSTSCRTSSKIADESSKSQRQIQRYIRLSYLNPSLLELVDEDKLTLVAGVEISFLDAEAQQAVEQYFFKEKKSSLDLDTATKLKETFLQDGLTYEKIFDIFSPKKNINKPIKQVTIKYKKIKKFFSENTTEKEIEDVIISLLEEKFKNNKAV